MKDLNKKEAVGDLLDAFKEVCVGMCLFILFHCSLFYETLIHLIPRTLTQSHCYICPVYVRKSTVFQECDVFNYCHFSVVWSSSLFFSGKSECVELNIFSLQCKNHFFPPNFGLQETLVWCKYRFLAMAS